jgi:hypothetical protein
MEGKTEMENLYPLPWRVAIEEFKHDYCASVTRRILTVFNDNGKKVPIKGDAELLEYIVESMNKGAGK